MERREECDTVLSEIKFLIRFQVFFELFRLSLKNFRFEKTRTFNSFQ